MSEIEVMPGQMNIFDFIPRPEDPVRNAIKHMRPYWTSSRKTILDAYFSGKRFVETVKHEFCPYGCSGFYGGDFGKKGVFTLIGWSMETKEIVFQYKPRMVETMTWNRFAEHIAELIRKGEFMDWRDDDERPNQPTGGD